MTITTDRQQFAVQHGMAMEFVDWFFDKKKDSCGNAWLIMAAAMWEGWKGRANREAQPVAVTDEMALAFHRALNDGGIGDSDLEEIKVGLRGALCNFTAPPAPAVPDKQRLPPHIYRDLLDMLQEAAIAYGGTQQLRAQLSSALSIHVQPDHPHTRTAMLAAAPEGGNDHDARR